MKMGRRLRCSSVTYNLQICSFVAACRRPILIATLLYQSQIWCTRGATVSVAIAPVAR
jgi:hypothetical protein